MRDGTTAKAVVESLTARGQGLQESVLAGRRGRIWSLKSKWREEIHAIRRELCGWKSGSSTASTFEFTGLRGFIAQRPVD
jgi:hypothetical protein